MSTGHLVYVRLGTLMAVPFDPVRLAVTGNATGLIDGVMQAANRNLNDSGEEVTTSRRTDGGS